MALYIPMSPLRAWKSSILLYSILFYFISALPFILFNLHSFSIFLTKHKVGQFPYTPPNKRKTYEPSLSLYSPLPNPMFSLASPFHTSCFTILKSTCDIFMPAWFPYICNHCCLSLCRFFPTTPSSSCWSTAFTGLVGPLSVENTFRRPHFEC